MEILGKLVNEDDEIKEDFLCNFRNNKQSYLLIAFKSGKFLILPLFIPAYVNYTEFDIYFLDSGIENWLNVFFKNDSLIITDENYFYSFTTSAHQNWEKIEVQYIRNIYKDNLSSLDEENLNAIKDKISIFWMKGSF